MGRWARTVAKAVTRRVREQARHEDVPVGTQEFDPAVVHLGMSAIAARVLGSADAEQVVRRRRANWLLLHERIGRPEQATWSSLPTGVCPLFYALEVDDKERALRLLWSRGIQAVDFWRSGHPSVPRGRFPEVEALRQRVVELPCHQDLGPEELEWIARVAREALET
jgi:dTDP-4-amino-4,6-dideoxygalactose transaminase